MKGGGPSAARPSSFSGGRHAGRPSSAWGHPARGSGNAPAGRAGRRMRASVAVLPLATVRHLRVPLVHLVHLAPRTAAFAARAGLTPRARTAVVRCALAVVMSFAMSLVMSGVMVRPAGGQARPPEPRLPFAIGEALEYQVRVARLGDVGTGRMWVEGPVIEQGVSVWRLRSEINAGKGPIRATDRTSSWLDPLRFAIVRFEKQERHVLSNSAEHVTVDRAAHRWTDSEGPAGALGSDRPLDELSFLYFLRTLPLDRDTVLRFDRHFDASRNPTVVRVRGEETLTTPAGIFRTRVVEMEVRDPKRYKGAGTIRLHLNVDACRIPIRIESRMPVLGTTTLTLTGWSHSPHYPTALPCD